MTTIVATAYHSNFYGGDACTCPSRRLLTVSEFAEAPGIIDVARQAGQSPTMALNTNGHVFDELEGAEPVSAEELIREARATLVCPPRWSVDFRANKNLT